MSVSPKFCCIFIGTCFLTMMLPAGLCLFLGACWTMLPCTAMNLLGWGMVSIGAFCGIAWLRILTVCFRTKI